MNLFKSSLAPTLFNRGLWFQSIPSCSIAINESIYWKPLLAPDFEATTNPLFLTADTAAVRNPIQHFGEAGTVICYNICQLTSGPLSH